MPEPPDDSSVFPAVPADSYETPGDQSLNVPAEGVLGNDIDPNRDSLTVTKAVDGTLFVRLRVGE